MSESNLTQEDTSRNFKDLSRRQVIRGRWKIGLGLFVIACIAQAIMWAMWWEDPTHFKMSVLFVWPAALFSLLIWWTFFSGWSSTIRFGLVGCLAASIGAFFSMFKFDRFDGDMVPTRIVLRSAFTGALKSQRSLEQVAKSKESQSQSSRTSHDDASDESVELPLVPTETDWPGYRGPHRTGVITNLRINMDWEARPPKEIWRRPVGRGWSSFAVVGELAFTQEQRESQECVVAYQLSDGNEVWVHEDSVSFVASDAQGGTGPRATPTVDEGKVYACGATGILNCLNARTGRLVWKSDVLRDAGNEAQPAANLNWGISGSTLIVDQIVIVSPSGGNGKSVIAYDKETGKVKWSSGDRPASYGSPQVAVLAGERQILVPLGTGLGAYSIEDGKELWFFPWENGPQVNAAAPVIVNDTSVLFGCGYGIGTVRLHLAASNSEWTVTQKWHSNRFRPKFNDFVLHDDHAFGLDDGTLTCLDVKNGKVVWKSGRYGYGQLLLIGNQLLILGEDGRVFVLEASLTKPSQIASFQALDRDSITWNHPVIVHGKLLVRNSFEAACFEIESN
ncbi:MAG: hypothetical protein FJ267_01560 [Planctomycetes bacterium]|nr:hypothetical protein [Planctomycetota bacterium]